MAIYWLANPIAALISFTLGGWLNELYGWRATFFIVGVPALLIALVVKRSIAEPRLLTSVPLPQRKLPRITDVLRLLWQQRSSRHLMFCIILIWAQGSGLGQWEAAFLMRSHGMSSSEVGVWLGLIYASSGIIGISLGGYVSSRWFAHDERSQLRVSAIMIAATVPFYVAFLLTPNKHYALIAMMPSLAVCNFFLGPTFALLQRLVPDDMRATALAVMLLLANLIGLGVGPQIVGVLSDLLMPLIGSDSLRVAMLIMSMAAFWSASHCWRAGRTVRTDLSSLAGTPAFQTDSALMEPSP